MDYITREYSNSPDSQAVDPYFGLLGEVVQAPKLDYLAIGTCVDPSIYHLLLDFFRRQIVTIARFDLQASKIYFDGAQVGQIAGAQGASSQWGRKICWNFTGQWFRAGLTESDAMSLIAEFEVYLAELPHLDQEFKALEVLRGRPWICFRSIDRADWCLEARCGRALIPDDLSVITGLPMGAGWKVGAWSKGGLARTIYASHTDEPLKNRGTFPHLIAYQTLEHLDKGLIRLEFRCPRILATDGSGSIDGAACLAADYFASILRRPVIASGLEETITGWPPDKTVYGPDDVVVKALDFRGKWLPEHHFRQAYAGHASKQLQRNMRQVVTTTHRTIGAYLTMKQLDLSRGREHSDEDKDLKLHAQCPFDLDMLDKMEEMLLEARKAEFPDTKPVALRSDAGKWSMQQNLTEFTQVCDRFKLPKTVRVWSSLDAALPPAGSDFYRHDHWLREYESYKSGDRGKPPRWE